MHDLFRYDGKRVLVVGCYSGMGAATARVVRALGAEVHGVDYREPDTVLDSFALCDLRDPAAIGELLESLAGPVHALFYCAGLPHTHPPLEVMKVNFAATRMVIEGLQPLMPRDSAVALISSVGGLGYLDHMDHITELLRTDDFEAAEEWCRDHPEVVGEGYMFSKEALIVYTMHRALATVRNGIRINSISPGPTATPMMPDFEKIAGGAEIMSKFDGPMERKATPDEMGWPLAFLNSDAASFINGFNLVIDGGFLAGKITGVIDMAALLAQTASGHG
jgi:NAD(P)-dependent dehydrogenase (short-subunit alcohol dehydrogenase family)